MDHTTDTVSAMCRASSRHRTNRAAFAVLVLASLSATSTVLHLYVEAAQHAHLDRSVMLSHQGHMVCAVPTARLTP